MCKKEASAALSLTRERLTTNYGDRVKREAKDQQALIFANALIAAGMTFELTDEHRKIGYGTIFEAMAAELHEQGANMKTKIHNGEEFENVYRQGCIALNSLLMEQWNNEVVYAIPRHVDDKLIVVITLDPDLVVNELGETAREVFVKREFKRSKGQVTASAMKLARSVGSERALATLTGIVTNLQGIVSLPHGSREQERLPEFLK